MLTIDMKDYFVNGEINLDLFLPRLDLKKLQLSLNDELFEKKKLGELKKFAELRLKRTQIFITPKLIIVISDDDKQRLIKKTS